MIYCVTHADVLDHLRTRGFESIGRTDETDLFARGAEVVSVRKPNVNGHVPEILIEGALDAAGLPRHACLSSGATEVWSRPEKHVILGIHGVPP